VSDTGGGPEAPILAGPSPRDPKSIDVWPTILATSRVWLRHAVPQALLFAAFIVPVMALFALSAPNLAGAMLGRTPTDLDPREWYGFAGVLLLAMTSGGLVTIAVLLLDDRVLAGRPVPGWSEAFGRALERVPAVFGAYVMLVLVLTVPLALLIGLIVVLGMPRQGEPSPAAAVGMVLGFLLALPVGVAVGTHLRFAPLLAAVRAHGPVSSLPQSVALVRGRCWRVLGYVLLVGFLVQAVLTGALSVGILLYALHPVAGCLAYALAMAVCMPYQILQEMALVRRLEALHAREAGDVAGEVPPEPEPEPEPTAA
jgi:hypothetical protein